MSDQRIRSLTLHTVEHASKTFADKDIRQEFLADLCDLLVDEGAARPPKRSVKDFRARIVNMMLSKPKRDFDQKEI